MENINQPQSEFLVVIDSDAFYGWVMVFRRPGWQMSRLPGLVRLPLERFGVKSGEVH
jgi:hypothetical protein